MFKTSIAKENILSKIRKGLSAHKLPMPFPEVETQKVSDAFHQAGITAEEQFATEFINLGGKFVFCNSELEMLENLAALYESRDWQKLFCSDQRILEICRNNKLDFVLPADIRDDTADACVTSCEALVARTGSFLISSKQDLGRASTVFYPVHIVIAYQDQVVPDIADVIKLMSGKYGSNIPSMINLNTGPSRTADIEKTLVVGIHGPKEIFCFYVNA